LLAGSSGDCRWAGIQPKKALACTAKELAPSRPLLP